MNEESKASKKPCSPDDCSKSSKLSQSLPEAVSSQCCSLSLHSYRKIHFTVTNLSPILSMLLAVLLPFPSSESVILQQATPFSWSSLNLSGLSAKSPCDRDCEW